MSTLPAGVTLQQIDGGPNYYGNNGLTNAVNMGWDDPSFFPIGPWFDMLITQSDADRWANLGWNTAYTLTSNSNISVAQANDISVIQYIGDNGASSLLPGTGAETVGLMAYDEPPTYQQGVVTPLSTTPNSVQDGRFWWMNNTWNFIVYGGLSGGPDGGGTAGSAAVLDTPVTTPDGTTRQIDTSSVDVYWFAGAKSNSSAVLYWEGMMYGQGEYDGLLPGTPTWSPLTPDQGARGSNYGTQIDLERAYTGGSTPIYAIVEDGGPYTSDTSASTYITPPELNWAVWSSLIHGARGVVYFNHTFAGPAQSDDNLADPNFQTVQLGQTVSMYTQVQNTDALVEQMAPVLNSPTADGYVTVSDPGYENGVTVSDFSGIEVTAKDDNGQFYILSDTRDSETQSNIPATFTLADKNATSVTVIGENRTIPVTNGVFTDTFATGATVHIYEVNDGPPVTVAGYLANRAALDAAGHIAIADTTSNVSASFDLLNADPNIASITLSAAGTPTLSLSVAQALNDTHALGAITNASYAIAVADSAANISANIDALNADPHLASMTLTNAGTPRLTLTLAEALNDTAALAKIKSNYTITISDTAANIESLKSAQIASLGSLHVSRISARDASVDLTVAQAVALENNSIPVSAPSGSRVSVSDTAACLHSLTAVQIAGLSGIIGAAGLQSNNANVTFSASQTSAILSAHLSVSAAGTYSVTEKFTSGAVISSSQGSNGGALTLSTSANGLTIKAGAPTLSVTAGSETIPLHSSANETINATNRTSETFAFTSDFGNDAILGFAASGANHDTLVFNTAMFSYLTPGMSQAQDLAQVLLHATSGGGMTTISDTLGDKLTLGSVNIAALSAHPADFKFVS